MQTGPWRRTRQPLGCSCWGPAGLGPLILLEAVVGFSGGEANRRRLGGLPAGDGIQARSPITAMAATSQGGSGCGQVTACGAAFHRLDSQQLRGPGALPDFQRVLESPVRRHHGGWSLLPGEAGRYPFHCGMNMVRGELKVGSETRRQENEPRSKGPKRLSNL